MMSGRNTRLRRGLLALAGVLTVAALGGAAAFAAVAVLGDQGLIVCVKNSNGGVRAVNAETDCTAQERAEALAGPGSTVAGATHAQSADFANQAGVAGFASQAGNANTLDGADLTQLVRDHERATGVFGAPPGSIFFMNVTCVRANDTVFNFGAVATNFLSLDPPPIVLESGEHNPRFWQMYMQNRDPDTVAQMSFHGSCVTVSGSPVTAAGQPDAAAGKPVLNAGVK
jgi:hypothetical protein